MRSARRSTLSLGALVLAFGCAHRALIETTPPGATLLRQDRVVGVAPEEIKVAWTPFAHDRLTVRVQLAGYRRVDVDLTRDLGPLRWMADLVTLRFGRLSGRVPRVTHQVLLVPIHGPAGTWSSEDVPE